MKTMELIFRGINFTRAVSVCFAIIRHENTKNSEID